MSIIWVCRCSFVCNKTTFDPQFTVFTTVSCQELLVILDTTLPSIELNVEIDVGRWRPFLLPTIWTWQNSTARLCKESELVLSFYISRSAARWERPWGVCLLLWDVTSCNVALEKVWCISSTSPHSAMIDSTHMHVWCRITLTSFLYCAGISIVYISEIGTVWACLDWD